MTPQGIAGAVPAGATERLRRRGPLGRPMSTARRALRLLPAAVLLLAPWAAMPADAWACFSTGPVCAWVYLVIDEEHHVIEVMVTTDGEHRSAICVYDDGSYWVAVRPDGECNPRPESPIPGFQGIPLPPPDELLP